MSSRMSAGKPEAKARGMKPSASAPSNLPSANIPHKSILFDDEEDDELFTPTKISRYSFMSFFSMKVHVGRFATKATFFLLD